MFSKIVTSLLVVLVIVLSAIVELRAQQPVKGGELILGATVRIDSLDPQTTSRASTRQILNNIFDPLIRQKPGDSTFYPGLATSWKVSEDKLSYTFTLRKDVKFHDGTPLNAAAVCFTFDRIVNPETQARIARGALGPYKSCDVLDDYTAKVNFSEPYAPFLAMAAVELLAPISPTAAKKYGADFGKNPVGTGPFMFKEWVPLQYAKFVRNPDYKWASPVYKHQGPAYLDSFVWKEIPEQATRVGALRSGEVQIAEDIPATDYESLKSDRRFQIMTSAVQGTAIAMQLNFKKFPTSELAVRQAMQYAVNQDVIVKTLYRGMYEPSRDLLDPTSHGYDPTIKETYRYDPQRAKDLLEKAGWKMGPDGIRVKDGKRLEVLFIMQPTFDAYNWGPFVQAQLRDVGIDLKLSKETIANLMPMYRKGVHNAADVGWTYPDPHTLKQLYYSAFGTTGFAYSHYDNPEVDRLLDEGTRELDSAKRADIYRKAQKLITADAVYLPIRRLKVVFGVSEKVKDLAFSGLAFPLFYDTYLEK